MSGNMKGLDTFDVGYAAAKAKFEQENEKLKADVAMLREAFIEYMGDPDAEPKYYQSVISETASSDAWLKEQKVKWADEVLETVLINIKSGGDQVDIVSLLTIIAADLRGPAEASCKSCNGNDGNKPCSYPSEGKHGCLRDARMNIKELT